MPSFSFYHQRDTYFQHLTPLTRIVIIFALMTLSILVNDVRANLVVFGATIALYATSRVEKRNVMPFVRIGALLSVIFSLQWFIFAQATGSILFIIGPLHITISSLEGVISNIFRIFVLILSSIILMSTTSERELVEGFRKVKVPYVVTFIFMLALRFLPTLVGDLDTIKEAQMARGTEYEKGSILERGKKLVSALIPLLVISFRRVEIVSNALEARAFQVGGFKGTPRTFYKQRDIPKKEVVIISVCIAIVVIIIVAVLFYGLFSAQRLTAG
ncbi:MAG: energy-coupling factor transporter transmembrane component T [archaeon]|nr:energy-coupling factor transporter transmembrane component T [archaeon]